MEVHTARKIITNNGRFPANQKEPITEGYTKDIKYWGRQYLYGGPIEWIKVPLYSKDNVLNWG
jgi:hypothetical protein